MQAPHAMHQIQDIKLKKAYVELLEFQIVIPLCFFKIFKGSGVKVQLFWISMQIMILKLIQMIEP